MPEQINEKISLLIDDELDSEQALSLLKKIQDDEELEAGLQRYQLIGQVLKNETCYLLDSDFADKIHGKIRDEPIFFIPAKKAGIDWRKTGFAMAASIVLAVVWLVNRIDKQEHSYSQQEFAMAVPQPIQPDAMNARFNDYLQAHDNSVYINNDTRVQPYARVVGYHQE